MQKHLSTLLPALALGCAYEAPVYTDATPSNVVSGTLLFLGDEPPSHAIVFVFDATNPPPPAGTGRPLTFATVPQDAWTSPDVNGLVSAPFAVPYLPDTTPENGLANGILLTVVVDQDDNFVPLSTVSGLAGSTYGDWVGTYVRDLVTFESTPLFVRGGQLLDEITLLVGQRQPIQRPAFTTVGDVQIDLAKGPLAISPAQVQTYRLRSSAIHTTYGQEVALDLFGTCPLDPTIPECVGSVGVCRCDPTATDPSEAAFWIWFVDQVCEYADLDGDGAVDDPLPEPEPCPGGDGRVDPYPAEIQAANGLKDVWPRIFIEYMGEPVDTADGPFYPPNPLGTFAFEGPDGVNTVPERWVGENFPLAYELNFQSPAALAPAGATFAPFPAQEMNVLWSPVLRHYHAGGQFAVDPANGPYDLLDLRCVRDQNGDFPQPGPGLVVPTYCEATGEVTPDQIPAGAWRVTVITHTGQTWILPNEIGLPAHAAAANFPPLTSSSATFDVSSQGRSLTFR